MTHALRITPFAALLALALAACDGPAPPPDAGCTPGNAGCACLEGELCNGGLACDTGICRSVDRRTIDVVDESARSCELVLVEDGTEVLGIEAGENVVGTSIHEAPRTAITFYRSDDTAFAPGAITVLTTDGLGRLTPRRARCFDRDGAELTGDPLRIGG
jgi:hypothetical protein